MYCGKKDKILAQNLWHLLGSKEMISVSRLWSIFHLSKWWVKEDWKKTREEEAGEMIAAFQYAMSKGSGYKGKGKRRQ